jgi:hypothetical protein
MREGLRKCQKFMTNVTCFQHNLYFGKLLIDRQIAVRKNDKSVPAKQIFSIIFKLKTISFYHPWNITSKTSCLLQIDYKPNGKLILFVKNKMADSV